MNDGYIITGTDTGVGKTVVAAGLSEALGAHYWKPIQSGLLEPSDTSIVRALAGERVRTIPEAYRLRTPCSPHEAARLDELRISASRLRLPRLEGSLIVEGAGGVMVPINAEQLMLDLFEMWALPTIIVARTTLGTINHSLLSIGALRDRGVDIAGIIFVGPANISSEATIVGMGEVTHLGRLPWVAPLDSDRLCAAFRANIKLDHLR